MAISEIMRGRTKADLEADAAIADKKALLEEAMRQKLLENIQSEFDKSESDASAAIDRILKVRSGDPREQ